MTTWHVNVGEVKPALQQEYGGNRSWVDCRTFGIMSAGQAPKYSQGLKKLKVRDVVYAYLSKHGYVGFGRVIEEAQMAKDVQLEDGPLLEHKLQGTFLSMHSDDPERCEYVVRIDWIRTLDRENAVHFTSAPVNPACKLTDKSKLATLRQRFDSSLIEVVVSPESSKVPLPLVPVQLRTRLAPEQRAAFTATADASGLTPLEKDWLDHSWSVVTDCDHIRECEANGGTGIEDVSLRWPGYLGEHYALGGVLLMANIHRNFASGGADQKLADDLVECTKTWRDSGRSPTSDAEYLAANRSCYLRGLKLWRVKYWFEKFIKKAGLRFDQVTYLNAARCQALTGACPRLQQLCLGHFPMKDLLDMLKPQIILTCSQVVLTSEIEIPIRWFHQRNGRDEKKRNFEEWSAEALEEVS